MNKDQALRKLCEQMLPIERLQNMEIFSSEFMTWRRNTETLIQRIFGEDTRQVKDFAEIKYKF